MYELCLPDFSFCDFFFCADSAVCHCAGGLLLRDEGMERLRRGFFAVINKQTGGAVHADPRQ